VRGSPVAWTVLRNIEPGHYRAEWAYGQRSLEVIVMPERVTRIAWRAVAWFGKGSGTDRMVPMAAAEAVELRAVTAA
jgi:hypothetical protein